jgi:transposase InsO family protein
MDLEKVIVEKLGTDNYHTWAQRMKFALILKGWWKAVEGQDESETNSAKALAAIGLAVEKHHLPIISKCQDAKEAWESLKATYEAKSNARKLQLKRELNHLRKEPSEPLTTYFSRATDIRDQLLSAGQEVPDDEIVLTILSGLPSEYDMVVTVLTTGNEQHKLDELLAKLLQVEQRSTRTPDTKERALFSNGANTSFRGRGDGRQSKPGGNWRPGGGSKPKQHSEAECWHCGRKGHIQSECRSKARGEPARGRNARTNQNGGHQPSTSRHSNVALMAVDDCASGWVLDSGASHHITSNDAWLTAQRPASGESSITFGNGAKASVSTIGNVCLTTGPNQVITLRDVMYIPSAPVNLLSIPRAIDRGARFDFSTSGCTIRVNERVVANANRHPNGLYYVSGEPTFALLAKPKENGELWHRRFGHLGYDNLTRLAKEDMVKGLDVNLDALRASKDEICEPCVSAKQHREPFPDSTTDSHKPLELLHMDLCGPLPVPSLSGCKYVITFLDDFSKYSVVRVVKHKDETAGLVQEVIKRLETQSGQKLKVARTDNGGEYVNFALSGYFKGKGIIHQTSVRYTPQQNGAAERLNKTLLERVRAMLEDSGLAPSLWAEAIVTANHLRNLSPVTNRSKTPWELFYGNKPDVSYLRTFGATAYAHVPKELRNKLESRTQTGVLVGYQPDTKGYRIMLSDNTVVVSRDVVFDEHTKHMETSTSPPLHLDNSDSEHGASTAEEDEEAASDNETPPQATETSGGSAPPAQQGAARYPPRERKQPSEWWKSQPTAMLVISEPSNLEEALASEHAEQWKQAMDDEIQSLYVNKTWTLEETPPGITPIPVRWVYKVKRTANGDIERFKARLVAKGFKQREGIDFEEVFAPVSKYSTVRAVLAVVAARDLEMHQLDIKTAFLYGEIKETVYIQQPPGYEEGGKAISCHLQRAIYGLKQAPRTWHQRLREELTAIGLKESDADASLYVGNHNGDPIYLIVYVDDILIIAKRLTTVEYVKDQLTSTFEARDLGEANYFLGMSLIRDRGSRTLKLRQERLMSELITKYGMDDAKPKTMPISTSVHLSKDDGEPLDKELYPYSGLVGSLMYLSVCTRPDISQAVGALARYMANPTTAHWQAAKGVVRYLSTTKDFGIVYGGSKELCAVGYSDADYAGDADTRRSTTGYVFILNGGAISWTSRRQATVAASTTEAEYMAAAAAIKEALWIRQLLRSLNVPADTICMLADNQSAIKLLKNPVFSMRSKHIDVAYHFAREHVALKHVEFEYIDTANMVADMLTKAVPEAKLNFCRKSMGLH